MQKNEGKRLPGKMKEGVWRSENETARAHMGLRVPAGLRKQLEAAAKRKGRSLSAEIEHRLEASFEAYDLVAATLTAAYGEEVTRDLFTFANTYRTMRTVSELKGRAMLSEDNEKLILASCVKQLTDMIEAMKAKLEEAK